MSDAYDVIVIGSGAGGGTLVHRLAAVRQADPPARARRLAPSRAAELACAEDVFVENRYVSPETWYDADGKAFQPQVHYFVGGATKLYGAALYRLREKDFGELRHHDGVSPAWPIGYDELEPYYTQAEQLYQVHGARGEDPTEPPASAPYPFPAVSHEPRIQQLSDDLAAAGYHPFHAPCGIMLDEGNMPYSRCVRCNDLRRVPMPRPRQVRCRGGRGAAGARASERHPAHQREGRPARHQRRGHRRHRGHRRAGRTRPRRSPATSSSSPAGRPTRPSCSSCRRATSIRMGSRTAPTRSVATSCFTTHRPCWRSPRKRTRRSSRRPSG